MSIRIGHSDGLLCRALFDYWIRPSDHGFPSLEAQVGRSRCTSRGLVGAPTRNSIERVWLCELSLARLLGGSAFASWPSAPVRLRPPVGLWSVSVRAPPGSWPLPSSQP